MRHLSRQGVMSAFSVVAAALLCVALFALRLLWVGFSPVPAALERVSVILITIDTLRHDRFLDGGLMPRLEALARRGVRFSQARAAVPLTVPSHATILTGRGPLAHGVRDNIGSTLPGSIPTVAAAFSGAGIRTAAFIGGYPLTRRSGLDRGFDQYDDRMTRESRGMAGPSERRAESVIAAARAWLGDHSPEPFFVWIHLYDPHEPYEPPASFAGLHSLAYDDEVAYVDSSVVPLLDWLESSGVGSRTWIFVTSDHGESLGEHGERTHGIFLYDSTLRVPLIVVPPGGCATRIDETQVQLADVAASMLDAAGLPPLPGAEGRSLLPLSSPRGTANMHSGGVYIESIHASSRYGWAPLEGWLAWPRKFIEAPRPELYDLRLDPGETVNLVDKVSIAEERRHLAVQHASAVSAEETPLDADALARLASLGYTGGSSARARKDSPPNSQRPDPKDRIAALPSLDSGLNALEQGNSLEAERLFRHALGLDPGNLVALNNLGILAVRQGRYTQAVQYFRVGLAAAPDAEEIANDLGMALTRLGSHSEAVEAYRKALAIRPGFAGARFNLAMVLHRMGSYEEALREAERAGREEPSLPGLADALDNLRRRAPRTSLPAAHP